MKLSLLQSHPIHARRASCESHVCSLNPSQERRSPPVTMKTNIYRSNYRMKISEMAMAGKNAGHKKKKKKSQKKKSGI